MWLVDPEAQTLEVMQLTDGHWTILNVFTADEKARAEPFPEAEIELTTLWGEESAPSTP